MVALLLAAFSSVIIFLPPEGRIAVPLHDALGVLLGRATFMLPLALAFVGLVSIVSALRPNVALPRRRLVGVALIAIAIPPSEHLLGSGGDGTGLIGNWLSSSLLDLVGGPLTLLVLVSVLGLGTLLAFDLRLIRVMRSLKHGTVDAEG
jgi:hypothetical protein